MRGRPRLPVGEYGKITVIGEKPRFIARCWYRDLDGVGRYVTARGVAKATAIAALKAKLDGRRVTGWDDITPDTRVRVLAATWLDSLGLAQSTMDKYTFITNKYLVPQFGEWQIREVTTSRVESFLRALPVHASATVPRECRLVLSMMFSMAARYDAVPANPVPATRLARQPRRQVTALSVEQFGDLRADIAAWAAVKPSRARVVDVLDVFIATGLRPGELLGLRFEDVDLKAGTVTITGTVKRDSVNMLHRQAFTKTEAGMRTLVLPDFALSVLRRRQLASSGDLVFPGRDGGLWCPTSFRRTWRDARGEKWADVQPRAFRRAVATLIEREAGSQVAAKQLGHVNDAVTLKHYVAHTSLAPDSRHALDQFRAAE